MLTNLQNYYKDSYETYLRLRTQLEIEDIEQELELEQMSFLEENLEYKDNLNKILREENII